MSRPLTMLGGLAPWLPTAEPWQPTDDGAHKAAHPTFPGMLPGLRREVDADRESGIRVVSPRESSPRDQYTAKTLALVDGLLARCAARHGVTPEAARSRRTAPAVAARHEWIRVLRDTWALSASETARLVGVDHTTVLYALGRRGAR